MDAGGGRKQMGDEALHRPLAPEFGFDVNFNETASKSVGLNVCVIGSSQDGILSSPETGRAVGLPLPPTTHGRATHSR